MPIAELLSPACQSSDSRPADASGTSDDGGSLVEGPGCRRLAGPEFAVRERKVARKVRKR
jgi:hypothetical protein